jgi:outer membrane autotransporter protein
MTYGSFGLRTNMALGGGALRFKGSAALRHAFGDTVPVIDLGFATGPGFVTAGNALDRDNAVVDAGLELDLARHVTLGISYAGSYGTRATDHGARAALSWRF